MECTLATTVVLACRWSIVLTLAYAGVQKLHRFNNFRSALAVVGIETRSGQTTVATALAIVECGLSFLLIAGVAVRTAGVVVALLMGLFSLFLLRLKRQGYDKGCGCFGQLREGPVTAMHWLRNGALGMAALLVSWYSTGPCGRVPLGSAGLSSNAAALFLALIVGLIYAIFSEVERIVRDRGDRELSSL
jgi:uncharacterized membrane protein YphA (DoxX/SURF4 family)